MAESALRIELRSDGVAVLTIDQPGSRANILTRDFWNELNTAFRGLTHSTPRTGLILRSAKPDVFIAGADLKFLGRVPAPNDAAVRELMEFGLATLALLEDLPYPTCAMINGAALGGGLEVALACDYRIIGENSKVELGMPEVKLGLIPGWGGTQRLPRIIGVSAATDLMLSGASFTAADALVHRLADGKHPTITPEQLFSSGQHNARRETKRNPIPESVRTTLNLHRPDAAVLALMSVVALSGGLPLVEALKLETDAFCKLAGSDDSRKRIREFFESRKK